MAFCKTIQKLYNPRLEDHGTYFIVYYTTGKHQLLVIEKRYYPMRDLAEDFANVQLIRYFRDFPDG